MRVDEVLARLGGVADASTLAGNTSRSRVRGALRSGLIIRDSHGHYALPGADDARRTASRLSGVLCLDSAAQHHGWRLKHPPSTPAIAVPRNRNVAADRRAGARLVYADLTDADMDGIATSKVRTVLDCASRLPFDEALTIADSALRAGDITRAELVASAEAMPSRYRRRCTRVAEAADARADNPFESVLRAIALDVPGLTVVPQQWVDELSRPDLVDARLRLAIEAESFEFHGKRRLLKEDCVRYNAFVIDGWYVVRFAWEHVMFEPAYVAFVLRSIVDRLSKRPSRRAVCAGCGA